MLARVDPRATFRGVQRAQATALALAAWTVFVWTTRIGNILGDDDLSAVGLAWRTGIALLMTVLAANVVWVALARRERLAVAVGGLAASTMIVWLVRLPGIVLGDHRAAFVIVHVGLAVVSVALAVVAVESAAGAPRDSGRAAAER